MSNCSNLIPQCGDNDASADPSNTSGGLEMLKDKYPYMSNMFFYECGGDSDVFRKRWLEAAISGDVEVFRNAAAELGDPAHFTQSWMEDIDRNLENSHDNILAIVNHALRSQGDTSQSALYQAALHGQSEVLKYLLQLPWTNHDITNRVTGESVQHAVVGNMVGNSRRVMTRVSFHLLRHPWLYCRRIYRSRLVRKKDKEAVNVGDVPDLDPNVLEQIDADLGYAQCGKVGEGVFVDMERSLALGAAVRLNAKGRHHIDVSDDTVLANARGELFAVSSQPPSQVRPTFETRPSGSSGSSSSSLAPRTLLTDTFDVAAMLVEYGATLTAPNGKGLTVYQVVPTNSLYRQGRWSLRWGLVRLRIRLYHIRKCLEEQLLRRLGYTMARIDRTEAKFSTAPYVCPLEGRSGDGLPHVLPNMSLERTGVAAVGVRDISEDKTFVEVMTFQRERVEKEQKLSVTSKKPQNVVQGAPIGGMGPVRREVERRKVHKRKVQAARSPVTIIYNVNALDLASTSPSGGLNGTSITLSANSSGTLGSTLSVNCTVNSNSDPQNDIKEPSTPSSLVDKMQGLVPGTPEYMAFQLNGSSGKKTPKTKNKKKKAVKGESNEGCKEEGIDQTDEAVLGNAPEPLDSSSSLMAVPESSTIEFPKSGLLQLPTSFTFESTESAVTLPKASPAATSQADNIDEEDRQYAHIENEFDDDLIIQADAAGQRALQMVSLVSHIIASYTAQSDLTSRSAIPDTVKVNPFLK